jgi:Domain of unknown function (DUF6046)
MSSLIVDIENLYQRTFGSRPYKIDGLSPINNAGQPYSIPAKTQSEAYSKNGSLLETKYFGVEIWLPVKFRDLDVDKFSTGVLELPYSVVRITGSSNWVKTPLSERRGSVKELYSIDDYKITIKGFFIDRDRVWPEDDLFSLKKIHEAGKSFSIDNALTNVFLNADDKVVMSSFELPEIEGGRKHVRPYVLQLESDSIFTLELE